MVILIVWIHLDQEKLKSNKRLCKNKDIWSVILSEQNMLLKLNQYQKHRKVPCIIYVDLEVLINKNTKQKYSWKIIHNKCRWKYYT